MSSTTDDAPETATGKRPYHCSKPPTDIPDIKDHLGIEITWWPLWVGQAYIYRKTRKWLTTDHIRHLGTQGAFLYGASANAPFVSHPVERRTFQSFVDKGERVTPSKKATGKRRAKGN